jgi:hypothetical protein
MAILSLITSLFLVSFLEIIGFNIEKSINVIDLISLLVTIFIAIYFGNYLKRKEDLGVRNREIILKYIEDVEIRINRYSVEYSEDGFDLISINRQNKTILTLINSIPKLMTKMEIEKGFYNFEPIISLFRNIHKLLTYYTDEDILDDVISIQDNKVSLNIERRDRIDSLGLDLFFELNCFKIKLSIL